MPSSLIETDALVIGAGPVGLFQVFQLGLLGISCHVIDALPGPGGQCAQLYGAKPIYDIPGTPFTTGAGLIESLLRQIEPFAPPFHWHEQIATLERQADGRWLLGGTRGSTFLTPTVFIAAGVGAFVPKRLTLPGLETWEGQRLFYHPENLAVFAGQTVVVQGDDEAALQAALTLLGVARSVTLLHRRDVFQAEPSTEQAVRSHIAAGTLALALGQLQGLDATHLNLHTPEGNTHALPLDALIAFPGLSPRLGPIADWDLALERKQLPVDTEKFQTQAEGVFAVGDINNYPGKKKLIVCGFHEATLAAWAAAAIVFPGQALPLQYTTTSTLLHQRLGVRTKD